MLQVRGLRKGFGAATVLDGISFVIGAGERVGLIGPNGAGKSTLLRCIAGEESPDAGSIVVSPPGTVTGYLPQTLADLAGRTVTEVLAAAQAELVEAESELHRASDRLAASGGSPAALAAYDAALARYEGLGGYERDHREAAVVQGLGLGDLDPATPVASLSGGQKTRLGLAALLLRSPDLLLLDEPTNHLDVAGLEWLEGFVQGYRGAVLVASHDRAFLDRTVTRILYLDPTTRAALSYPGSYREFAAARAHERELHEEAWKRQEEYVARVEADVARIKGEARAIEEATTSRQPNVRRLARKMARLAQSRERKLERYLASDERVDQPSLTWGLKLDFGPPPPGGRDVLRLDHVRFAYPGQPLLLRDASFAVRHGERVALVGSNGAGKTTLLRLIEGRLAPLAGKVHLGAGVKLGVLAQEHETLDLDRTVLQTALDERPMGETEARHFLHYFLFAGDAVFRKVGDCSLGERSRLQLARLVLRGCNLLLLDEPLNHLDIEGREHFESALAAYAGTVIVVAHDRAFLQSFARRTLEVRDGRVTEREA
jgi:ATP-binding cassette subfamily F protein 3